MNPAGLTGASHSFNDLDRPQNTMGLARTLKVAAMVIAVGPGYTVITAEDHDSSLTIVNEYDFTPEPPGGLWPPPLSARQP